MQVVFFFGPGSRYSYLAATQLEAVTAATGARFLWRPVLSLDLVARTGGVHRSPQDHAYRTTDVARWARLYDVPFNDIAVEVDWRRWAMACAAAQRLDAAEVYAKRLYRQAYAEGRPPLDDAALVETASAAGLDPAVFRRRFEEAETAEVYQRNLEDALAAGAFGVPTFVTDDGALFWGQDRLPLLVDHLSAASARG